MYIPNRGQCSIFRGGAMNRLNPKGYKLDENTGKRWLAKHGGDIKGSGVGYSIDVQFDRSKIITLQHLINQAALRGKEY